MNIPRDRRLEMALEQIAAVASAAFQDLDRMKQLHAASKRGSNYQRALDSLEERLRGIEQEAREQLAADMRG